MRFITFETLVTGVRAFEWAFSVRTSSFVHGLMTRRAVTEGEKSADLVLARQLLDEAPTGMLQRRQPI